LLDEVRELARGRTTIVITHDPAVIAEADEVIVFDEGRIPVQPDDATVGTPRPVAA